MVHLKVVINGGSQRGTFNKTLGDFSVENHENYDLSYLFEGFIEGFSVEFIDKFLAKTFRFGPFLGRLHGAFHHLSLTWRLDAVYW